MNTSIYLAIPRRQTILAQAAGTPLYTAQPLLTPEVVNRFVARVQRDCWEDHCVIHSCMLAAMPASSHQVYKEINGQVPLIIDSIEYLSVERVTTASFALRQRQCIDGDISSQHETM